MNARSSACCLPILQVLLEAGADADALLGCHPARDRLLHFAAENGMMDEAELLMARWGACTPHCIMPDIMRSAYNLGMPWRWRPQICCVYACLAGGVTQSCPTTKTTRRVRSPKQCWE